MKTILSGKRHRYLAAISMLLILPVTLVLISGMIGCGPVCEDLQIQTWYDLDDIRNNLGCNHILMNNLDSTTLGYAELASPTANEGKGWEPIGAEGNAFKGTFDGGGHTISDLYIYRPDEDEVGLFGRVQEGLIRNLGLEAVNVTGKEFVGALVGYNWKGTLDSDSRPPGSKTYSSGSVAGEEHVGGLVGDNYGGTINQCESDAEVLICVAPGEKRHNAGGLVGLNSGHVLFCESSGGVNGDRQVGGFVGMNARYPAVQVGVVEDCCSRAYTVNGTNTGGGFVGLDAGIIRRCSRPEGDTGNLTCECLIALNEGATGNADSSDTAPPGSYFGSFAGLIEEEGIVEDSSTGAGTAVVGVQQVGGFVGCNRGTVTGCNCSGQVTGSGDDVGQFAGYNTGTVSYPKSTSCVTGMSGCGPLAGRDDGTISGIGYNLHMAVAPIGTGTATDMRGGSPYAAGVSVSIEAVPAAGYQFVGWTALAGMFANANGADTTFTMPAEDVTVTANFAMAYTDFACYMVYEAPVPYMVPYIREPVYLEDEFCAVEVEVQEAWYFCNPVEKEHNGVLTPISSPDHHFTAYGLAYGEELQEWSVAVDNQFGTQQLTVRGPVGLAVPTQKVEPWYHEPPVGLDHYLLYEVVEGRSVDVVVGLNDEFGSEEVLVTSPVLFANPVRKTHGGHVTEILNPEAHGVIYWIECQYFGTDVQIVNQFGEQTFQVWGPALVAIASEMLSYEAIS
jgi:uncharacterized repeat protein (TIGR02543 family)